MPRALLVAALWAVGAGRAHGLGQSLQQRNFPKRLTLRRRALQEPNWTDLGRSIKIYVYDLPPNVSLHVEESVRNRNYYYELEIALLLKASALHRTLNPKEADFFYVPAELNSHWFLCWKSGCSLTPPEADRQVVAFLRSVGPFWDKQQQQHLVPSLACPVLRGKAKLLRPTYPQLWDGKALQLCLWADRQTIDARRSLHVGYYVPGMGPSEPLPGNASGRDILAVYIGAQINRERMKVATWMKHFCPDCRAFVVEEHGNASDNLLRDYHATLRRARFAIEPPGDTMERMSRDASVLAGAIPVIFDNPGGLKLKQQYLPWQPVVDWSSFSVNFSLTNYEAGAITDFVPRLDQLLRGMVRSGEADRLYQGLVAAQTKLRWSEDGIVSTLAALLARKRYLSELGRTPWWRRSALFKWTLFRRTHR